MRFSLASTRATTRKTVARASSAGKQQRAVVVAATAAAAPVKPAPIEAKKSTSTTPVGARLFSAAAAAMIAVTAPAMIALPAFADLNSLEAAAGGGACRSRV